MACGGTPSFREMIEQLEKMAKSVPNDERQKKYCEYISMFLSHYSKERFVLTGSTPQKTRLRANENEGDFDYLVISSKRISAELIEYHPDVPCFVKIKGDPLKSTFPEVNMIDGKYLPSNLLSEASKDAFGHARNIFQLMTSLGYSKGRHTLHIYLDQKIKPGMSRINYANPVCPELCNITERPNVRNENVMDHVQNHYEKEKSIDELARNIIRVANSAVKNYERKSKAMDNNLSPENKDRKSTEDEAEASAPACHKTCTTISDAQTYLNATTSMSQDEVLNGSDETQNNISDKDMVTIQYTSKTSKDFIPVFPIDGQLKFLEDWKNRPGRKWPSLEVVEEICSSEFYVIAKPALVEPEIDKDFCLAFNNAELKLADAMTNVQRIVMLIIKAFQKGILKEHSDEVTSFHWKTVIYWVSERTDQSVLQNNTDENIKHFLTIVLEFMTDSLCEKNLTHFFLPSNLFAGKDENALHEVLLNVASIQENPVEYLQTFLVAQKDGQVNYDMVPRWKIREFNHTSGSSEVELIIQALKGFTSQGRDKLKIALKHVASEGFSYFIEEESRGRDKKNLDSMILETVLKQDFARDALIDSAVSLLINESGREGTLNIQEITQRMLSLVYSKVMGK